MMRLFSSPPERISDRFGVLRSRPDNAVNPQDGSLLRRRERVARAAEAETGGGEGRGRKKLVCGPRRRRINIEMNWFPSHYLEGAVRLERHQRARGDDGPRCARPFTSRSVYGELPFFFNAGFNRGMNLSMFAIFFRGTRYFLRGWEKFWKEIMEGLNRMSVQVEGLASSLLGRSSNNLFFIASSRICGFLTGTFFQNSFNIVFRVFE